jgi:hypothetical protein
MKFLISCTRRAISITPISPSNLLALLCFFSIVATYTVVAYQAGRKLTTSQVFIATTIYLFAALLFGFTNVLTSMGARVLLEILWGYRVILEADFGVANNMVEPGWLGEKPYFMVLLVLFCVIAPLYFMWGVRHPKTE